jgi:hypothetical protein
MDIKSLKNVAPIFQTLLNNAKSGIPKKIQVFIGILAFIWLFPIILDILFVILGVFFDYKSELILKFLPRVEQLISILTGVSAVACLMAIIGLFTDSDGDGIPDSVDKDNHTPVTNNTFQVNVGSGDKTPKLPNRID